MSLVQTEKRLESSSAIHLPFKSLLPTRGAVQEIASLDGLRALAILLVIWCHLNMGLFSMGLYMGPAPLRYLGDFGFTGVFLFFVLSGFLLFLPYARALLANHPWPSARQFFRRRVLRILPLYYVALGVYVLAFNRPLLSVQNILPLSFGVLLLQDLHADAFNLIFTIYAPFWTLAVEWQFYLLLPWIAAALAKIAGTPSTRGFIFRLFGGLAILITFGLGLRCVAAAMYYEWSLGAPLFASGILGFVMKLLYGAKGKYLEVFALGMAASVLYVWIVEQERLEQRKRKQIGVAAALIGIGGLGGCLLWAAQAQRIPFPSPPVPPLGWGPVPSSGWLWQVLGEWATGVCFALLLLAVLLGVPVLQGFFRLPPMRFIGIISYSLYVWHNPLLAVLILAFPSSLPGASLRYVVCAMLVLLLWCSASYYLIERPFTHFRRSAHFAMEITKRTA